MGASIHELWIQILNDTSQVRGGVELVNDLGGTASLENYLLKGDVWTVWTGPTLVALLIVTEGVIKVLYVVGSWRRRGIARGVLNALRAEGLALEAHALPGDRATKMLYEAIGWRARLLTMRGDDSVDELT